MVWHNGGERPASTASQPQPNRRKRGIQYLRGKIKALNKLFKACSSAESRYQKPNERSARTTVLRLESRIPEAAVLEGEKTKQFVKDPYSFTKTLIGQQKSGTLSSSKSEIEGTSFWKLTVTPIGVRVREPAATSLGLENHQRS